MAIRDGAVAGEMGEEFHHRDFRAVLRGEPGEAIGALPRAAPTADANDDIGVGGKDIGAGHERTYREHMDREGDGSYVSRARSRSKPAGWRRVSGSVDESAARAERGNAIAYVQSSRWSRVDTNCQSCQSCFMC